MLNWESFERFCIGELHYKASTYSVRKRHLRLLLREKVDIDNPDSIYFYFHSRISDGCRGYQLNNHIKALNSYYKFKKYGHRFKLFRSFDKPLRIPSEEDISLLLSRCSRNSEGKTLKTMIFLFCHTGLRNEELCNLRFDDIDWKNNTLTVTGKWDRTRVVPVKSYVLHGKYVPSLKNYISHHRVNKDSRFVFTKRNGNYSPSNVRKLVKHVARSCGIGWVHPHSFRHFYATMLLSNGVNIKIVQSIMGHGNIRETSRYLHAQEVDIRRAIDEAGFSSLLKTDFNNNSNSFLLTNIYGGK